MEKLDKRMSRARLLDFINAIADEVSDNFTQYYEVREAAWQVFKGDLERKYSVRPVVALGYYVNNRINVLSWHDRDDTEDEQARKEILYRLYRLSV